MANFDLNLALQLMAILLISITIHELAHAVAADRLGDPTPRRFGELSLNPVVHFDQVGLILLVLTSFSGFGFTYGRTRVTPSNLRFGAQRGGALVAIVGPLSNLILAAVLSVVLNAGINGTFLGQSNGLISDLSQSNAALNFVFRAMQLNLLLFALNLLPLPPLDGFTVLGGFLSARQMYSLAPLIQWGPLVLLVIFVGEPQLHILGNTINPAIDYLSGKLCSSCGI